MCLQAYNTFRRAYVYILIKVNYYIIACNFLYRARDRGINQVQIRNIHVPIQNTRVFRARHVVYSSRFEH